MYNVYKLLEKYELLERRLKSIKPFTGSREKNSRFCISCGELATKIVSYSIEGAVIIEKHCDACAKKVEDSSPK